MSRPRAALAHVTVSGVPEWVPLVRLLDTATWTATVHHDGGTTAGADLPPPAAADLGARLRGVGIGGRKLAVTFAPPLPRALVRAARTTDARRRRDTTPGFARSGVQLDDEGRISLTPEVLALALGRQAHEAGFDLVVDLGCGCGGNAIGFARSGCRVVAIERSPPRLAMAMHNAGVYGVADRIEPLAADAAAALAPQSGDLLFVDPPWGPDWNRERTVAADFPLLGLALDHRARFRAVWAKVAPSFDPATVPGARPEAWFGEAPGDRQRVKFVLLRL